MVVKELVPDSVRQPFLGVPNFWVVVLSFEHAVEKG